MNSERGSPWHSHIEEASMPRAWCSSRSWLQGPGGCEPGGPPTSPADGADSTVAEIVFESIETGPEVEDRASTGGVSWVDIDGDVLPDLAVTNAYDVSQEQEVPQANRLYLNRGAGRYEPVEGGRWSVDEGFSPGSTWGDFDNDGDLDALITNQLGQENFLYENLGGAVLERLDAALLPASEGEVGGGQSFSASWADVDGWLDLFVANWGAASIHYRNEGTDLEPVRVAGLTDRIFYASSLAWADADRDGRLDLYLGSFPNRPGPGENNHRFRNRTKGGHWLEIRLQGGTSNRSAIGARIRVEARIAGQETSQIREISSQTSWRSQDDLVQHLGLGDATRVDRLTIRWPSGTVDELGGIEADQLITVREGSHQEDG